MKYSYTIFRSSELQKTIWCPIDCVSLQFWRQMHCPAGYPFPMRPSFTPPSSCCWESQDWKLSISGLASPSVLCTSLHSQGISLSCLWSRLRAVYTSLCSTSWPCWLPLTWVSPQLPFLRCLGSSGLVSRRSSLKHASPRCSSFIA